jgi:hypothetical protein
MFSSLLIINYCHVSCVFGAPNPIFSIGLNFVHHSSIVRRNFQEHNPDKQ